MVLILIRFGQSRRSEGHVDKRQSSYICALILEECLVRVSQGFTIPGLI
jgi:hypothetical protein